MPTHLGLINGQSSCVMSNVYQILCLQILTINVSFKFNSINTMPRLSNLDRAQIIGQIQAGVTRRLIALPFNVHKSTISRLVRKHPRTGDVKDLPKPELRRSRVTTRQEDNRIATRTRRNRRATATDLQRNLLEVHGADHRQHEVDVYLDDNGVERMDWPAKVRTSIQSNTFGPS